MGCGITYFPSLMCSATRRVGGDRAGVGWGCNDQHRVHRCSPSCVAPGGNWNTPTNRV